MNRRIKELAETTGYIDILNKKLVKTGFELEFQSVDGESWDREIDEERFYEDMLESWHNLTYSDMQEYGGDSDAWDLITLLDNNGYSWRDSLRGDAYGMAEEAIDRAREGYEEYCREHWDLSDYYENDHDIDCDYSIDVKGDESVRGGEITPDMPVNPQRALTITEDLFDSNDFEIDTRCSYHIHLSVTGVEHIYGQQLQAEMLAYILDSDIPKFLQRRLNSNDRRYCKTLLSKDKFSAINFTGKTWEFRLFGNVSNIKQARWCYRKAVEALRHGYRVKLGMEKSLLDGLTGKDKERLFEKLESTTSDKIKPIKKALRVEQYETIELEQSA